MECWSRLSVWWVKLTVSLLCSRWRTRGGLAGGGGAEVAGGRLPRRPRAARQCPGSFAAAAAAPPGRGRAPPRRLPEPHRPPARPPPPAQARHQGRVPRPGPGGGCLCSAHARGGRGGRTDGGETFRSWERLSHSPRWRCLTGAGHADAAHAACGGRPPAPQPCCRLPTPDFAGAMRSRPAQRSDSLRWPVRPPLTNRCSCATLLGVVALTWRPLISYCPSLCALRQSGLARTTRRNPCPT